MAQQWFEIKSKSSLQESTLKDIWRSLELHVLPHVGDIAIADLKARHFIYGFSQFKSR
ncbi:hypothetical protein AB6E88_05345 [Providencia hangzhouensis]